MAIQEVTSYKTSDGKTFTDAAQAQAHEEMLTALPLIVKFAEAKSDASRTHTRTINLLTEWEAYKASGGTIPVVRSETPEKKPVAKAEAPVESEGPVEVEDQAA